MKTHTFSLRLKRNPKETIKKNPDVFVILTPKTSVYSFVLMFHQNHWKDYNKMQYKVYFEDEGVNKEG